MYFCIKGLALKQAVGGGPAGVPVGGARAGVGGVLAAEEGGVPQTAVVGGHVDLGPHAAALPGLRARLHLSPHLHVLLHRWTWAQTR